MVAAYRDVLRTPRARRFFLSCVVGRFGIAMTNLAILWLVHAWTGSYAVAGATTGALALAETVSGPVVARVVDRRGQGAVLPWAVSMYLLGAGALVGLAAHGRRYGALLIVAGLVVGCAIPQFGALSAARWSALLEAGPGLRAAFALEAISNDAAYLFGPALVSAVSAGMAPAGVVLATSAIVVAGLSLGRQRDTDPISPRHDLHHRLEPGASSPRRTLAALVLANFGLGFTFGSLQVGVTAFAQSSGDARFAGVIYAALSVGSLAGGYFCGRHLKRPGPTSLAAFTMLLASAVWLLYLAKNPVELGFMLIVPGTAIAPTLIVANLLTQATVPIRLRTQAFTWQNSASTVGASIAATLTGVVVDGHRPQVAFVLVAGVLSLVSMSVWILYFSRRARDETDRGEALS